MRVSFVWQIDGDVPAGDLPYPDSLVAAGGDERLAIGHEAHAGDGMVVAVEGPDVCVLVGGVPELEGEVGGACGWR